MGKWTAKKVPIIANREDLEETEGRLKGEGAVMLDDCPFKQEVTDERGNVVKLECADDSGVSPCNPDTTDCKLQQWMESVKAFIRQIDVEAL